MQMHGPSQTSTLRDFMRVAQRRKWLIVVATVLVPLGALLYSLQQEPVYEGSAQVLLSERDLGTQLTGTQVASTNDPADRRAQTQVDLARVPRVAEDAVRELRIKLTPEEFLGMSAVTSGANSDILTFSATSSDSDLATGAAAAYASAYVDYRLAVETAPIRAARREVEVRIARTPVGALYNNLVDKQQTLQQLETLKTSSATIIKSGEPAAQISPRPVRSAVIGLVMGLLIGLGIAFLREMLDVRIRTADEISERLGVPLLARLPPPPGQLGQQRRLAMLNEPTGIAAEAIRMLRTNLEFASLGKRAQMIMVASAVEKEGKSTTLGNLAVALARSGQRVILADFDLRRPILGQLFDLEGHEGVTGVAVGHVHLDDALKEVPIEGLSLGNSNAHPHGSLHVLASGPIPPDPGEFVGTERVDEILAELRERADVVLVDAPPLLRVGDGLVLSGKVDAVLVVARIGVVQRPMIDELKRLIESIPATTLGFVVTGADTGQAYGYGYGYGYESHPGDVHSESGPVVHVG